MWGNILTRIKTEDNKVFGFKVRLYKSRTDSKVVTLRTKKCMELIEKGIILNAVIVNGETGKYIRSKMGNFAEGIVRLPKKPVNQHISNTPLIAQKSKEQVTEPSRERVGAKDLLIKAYEDSSGMITIKKKMSLSKTIFDKTTTNKLTVEEKMIRSMILLQKLRPFYSILYQSLSRVESTQIKTMGVTSDTFIFNPYFVAGLRMDELLFVHMHEILHIAMLHPMRGRGKDPTVYNQACDLIINKMLSEEFGLENTDTRVIEGIKITRPEEVLYEYNIDLTKESADTLYDKLMEKYKKQPKIKLSSGQSMSKDASDEKNKQNKDIYGDDELNTEGNSEATSGSGTDDSSKEVGSLKPTQGKGISSKEVEKRKLIESKIRSALTRSKLVGKTAGNTERLIEDAIAPVIDWKTLLRKYVTEVSETYSSLSNPDRRFLHNRMVMPSETKLNPDTIKGLKICIDTSGSISNEDLGIIYKQLKDLFKVYKTRKNAVDAEVLYWDTAVQSKGMFSDLKQFDRIKAKGGGGTDVKCVFEYLESKDCKIKPNVVVIFTDGFFNTRFEKRYKYTKNVVWIISGNEKAFKPPFGKVAKYTGKLN